MHFPARFVVPFCIDTHIYKRARVHARTHTLARGARRYETLLTSRRNASLHVHEKHSGYLKRKFEVCTWLRVYLPWRLGAERVTGEGERGRGAGRGC